MVRSPHMHPGLFLFASAIVLSLHAPAIGQSSAKSSYRLEVLSARGNSGTDGTFPNFRAG